MLLQQLSDSRLELTTIVTLEYLGIGERTNLVNVSDHVGYVFLIFHSQRFSNFVSGSDINTRENVLVLIPIQRINILWRW